MAKNAAAATAATEKPPADRGEDFFLYGSMRNPHAYGRDDLAGLTQVKSEQVLHSAVDLEEAGYYSQYQTQDPAKSILSATRHLGSYRYQDYKAKTGLCCCVAALGELRNLRGRAWNEDIVDACLDVGYHYFKESLDARGGELRRLILPELNENVNMSGVDYTVKLTKGVAVWGRLGSTDAVVLDLKRGLEEFFKDTDAGILQIPADYEVAIFLEGGKYYMFDPWPANRCGRQVGLREGGKAYVACFTSVDKLADHFMNNLTPQKKRKAFSISEVRVSPKKNLPEPVASFKGIGPTRWIVAGRLHQGDAQFPEANRNKQDTPTAITAIALSHIQDSDEWTADTVDQAITSGDNLYSKTIEKNPDAAGGGERRGSGDADKEVEGEDSGSSSATLPAGVVLNKFAVSEIDFIETEVNDSKYTGMIFPTNEPGVDTLKQGLDKMFKDHSHAVVTARGASVAVWKKDKTYYYFDSRPCDENGIITDSVRSAACVMRIEGGTEELTKVIEANLVPGSDDAFSISPVSVVPTIINSELGMPEIKLQNEAFDWMRPGTAALLLGVRGENTALGKVAERAGVTDDFSGRTLALPAAAAFTAAAAAVPPPLMHQDHMHHFLEAGADFYLEHLKKTGRREVNVEDMQSKFELGANTFSIELGDPIKMPLKLPDAPLRPEGEEEEKEIEEGEEEIEEEEEKIKDITTAIQQTMYLPNSIALLYGDYHILGLWCDAGGQVVAFDPSPTLKNGVLTSHRIDKGDELRLKRIEEEKSGEGGDDEGEGGAEEEEIGGEGPPPPPLDDKVPPESAPALHIYASPGEFVDRLVSHGGLTTPQRIAPYKLYPVKITNQLTCNAKDSKPKKEGDEDQDEEEEEAPAAALPDDAVGPHFQRVSGAIASVRARVAQHEYFFMEENRNVQDVGNAVMGIVVDNIESHRYWKPPLCDAILKYGDRLYTCSLSRAKNRPWVKPEEVVKEFKVVNFIVKLTVEPDVVVGDTKAGDSGEPLSVKRAVKQFFDSGNKHGVLCSKNYCVGIWLGADGKSCCMWEPHAVGASGKVSPSGAAALVVYATPDSLASAFISNVDSLSRPGNNKFSISAVKVDFTVAPPPPAPLPSGALADEGYEHKVLTAYVEIGKGRTILRGTRAPDVQRFKRDTLLQSSCGAIVGACMASVRRPELWTRHTVDEILRLSVGLFSSSLAALGYEFRPGEDVLLPLQVLKRYILGVNFVRFELDLVCTGKVEKIERPTDPDEMNVRTAIERYMDGGPSNCIIWCASHAVAAWRMKSSPFCYMFEPHACGPTGLRMDGDDGAACVLTFATPKMLSAAYLMNVPKELREEEDYYLYSISVSVHPIKPCGGVEAPAAQIEKKAHNMPMPATSKVDVEGNRRMMFNPELPPPRQKKLQTVEPAKENFAGWLVTADGAQYMSAEHSMHSKKYSYYSRGYQGLAMCVMGVVTSYIEEICRWGCCTINQVMDQGDQLYKDSYMHYRPKGTKYLNLQQILRKFYTPANCVYRLTIYCARHGGDVCQEGVLYHMVNEFFREERSGVIVSGTYSAALFRTPRGFYMFEPDDRDRIGRPVSPKCRGKMRACLSQFPNVQMLAAKLLANIPREKKIIIEETNLGPKEIETVAETPFKLHGANVTVSKAKAR